MNKRVNLTVTFSVAAVALALPACDPLKAYIRTGQVLDQRVDMGCVQDSLVGSEGHEHVRFSSNGDQIAVKAANDPAPGFWIGVRIARLESGSSRLEAYSQGFREIPDEHLRLLEREQRRILLTLLHDCGGTSVAPNLRCATWPSGPERPSCFEQ